MSEFAIAPSEITVQVGQPVTFNLKNTGRFPHQLYFHGLTAINEKMGANIPGGQSATAQVTFTESGLYPLYCPVGPHESRGMYGTLKVVGPPAAQSSIKIGAPASGATVVGPDVVVAVGIRGFDLDESAIGSSANKPGSGHWHLLLDGKLVGPAGKLQSVLKAVPLGVHAIKAELHNNDHSPLTPPVEDSVNITVAAPPTPTPAPSPTPSALAPLSVDVTLSEFAIAPSEITVQVGQPVTFNLKNTGRFPHQLYFHGLTAINEKMGANIAGGQSATAQVTFTESGLYPLYCPVGPHESRGMYGTLKVVGPPAAQPSIKIGYPASGATVVGPNVVVAVGIRGFDLDEAAIGSSANKPGSGHWHLLLDGKLAGPVGKLQGVLKDVALGQHTVKAELHNNDHSALTPPVEDSVTITVAAPPTPTPAPSPTPSAQAPAFTLTILEPEIESVVTKAQITVKGKTAADAVVSVNGQPVAVDATGAFSAPVTLQQGPNTIEVVASDYAGHQQSVVLKAIYTP